MRVAWLLPLLLWACADETLTGYAAPGSYILEELNGTALAGTASVDLSEPGELSGQTACNRFGGTQSAPYPWFEAEVTALTKRACIGPQGEAEQQFLEALERMTLSEVSGDILLLSNEAGEVMAFRRQRP